jgi:hypothetical protein
VLTCALIESSACSGISLINHQFNQSPAVASQGLNVALQKKRNHGGGTAQPTEWFSVQP